MTIVTGVTSVTGDLGTSPIGLAAITGFDLIRNSSGKVSTSSLVAGNVDGASQVAPTPSLLTTAVGDMQTAFLDAVGRTNYDFTELYEGVIEGKTLVRGLYKWSTDVAFTNGVTFDGTTNNAANPDAIWILQVAKDVVVGSGAIVKLAGGAQAENIF